MCIYSLGCYMPNHYSGVVEAPPHRNNGQLRCGAMVAASAAARGSRRADPWTFPCGTCGYQVDQHGPSISINDTWYPPVIHIAMENGYMP